MKLSELIAAVGDDNVCFQNLDQDAVEWRLKGQNGLLTFATDPEEVPVSSVLSGEGIKTQRLGLVVWLPREAVEMAMRSE